MGRANPVRALRINGRHPDARGCVLALPLNYTGGSATRIDDLTRRFDRTNVWTAAGQTAKSYPFGGGIDLAATTGQLTHALSQQFASEMTVMWRYFGYATGSAGSVFMLNNIQCGLPNGIPGLMQIPTVVNSTVTVPAGASVLGVRFKSGAVDFFVNGYKETHANTATFGASASDINHISGANVIQAGWADIRVWGRFMPDAAFERYYYEGPAPFYIPARRVFKAPAPIPFNASRFMPFMHPTLQS